VYLSRLTEDGRISLITNIWLRDEVAVESATSFTTVILIRYWTEKSKPKNKNFVPHFFAGLIFAIIMASKG
jgi:hypothetical protein